MEQVVSNREWREMSGRVWNISCGIVYMGEMRGRGGVESPQSLQAMAPRGHTSF